MSEGCPGCFTSVKGQQEALNNTINQAIQYAKEQGQTIAIYQEGYEYRYTTYDIARAEGYLIKQVVSQYS